MDAYTGFAYVYDEYMDNIPYEDWAEYLISLLKEYNVVPDAAVADLGCGTGNITRLLDREGYDCIGIDMSEDMLVIASEKMYEDEQQIIYSQQDMRDFGLPYQVDACISLGDSMNYITSEEDLQKVFECVHDNLADGGVFIFDLKTIPFFRDILKDNTYAQNRDDSAFIWDNTYDSENRNNIYDLAVFVKDEDGAFQRYEENHYQHGFYDEEVLRAAKNAGLKKEVVYEAFGHSEPNENSERLYYIFRK